MISNFSSDLRLGEGNIEDKRVTKTFKIILVGEMGVGKTAIINRFTQDVFYDDTCFTIGVKPAEK